MDIKVGFLIAYDYAYLKQSLPLVYDQANSVTIALDKSRKTFAGESFVVDPERLWHKPAVAVLELQRQAALEGGLRRQQRDGHAGLADQAAHVGRIVAVAEHVGHAGLDFHPRAADVAALRRAAPAAGASGS